jgi:hypothetical protein
VANTTFEQYNNVSFHDGVVDIVPQFLKTTQNVMYRQPYKHHIKIGLCMLMKKDI